VVLAGRGTALVVKDLDLVWAVVELEEEEQAVAERVVEPAAAGLVGRVCGNPSGVLAEEEQDPAAVRVVELDRAEEAELAPEVAQEAAGESVEGEAELEVAEEQELEGVRLAAPRGPRQENG
jgi:hypothetical protein